MVLPTSNFSATSQMCFTVPVWKIERGKLAQIFNPPSKVAAREDLKHLTVRTVSFRRGQALTIVAQMSQVKNSGKISGLRLRYRRVNQADIWQMIDMEKSGADYRASIAANYTDSPFPLQYHFQIHAGDSAWLHPGLEPGWNGQPYFVVRQA